ncbi:MAG: 16S rRNA (uracil(1498)-N(3))-methyltransferase [Bdellovibrio sp.]|nr:16S rRNA (uracil(1498)-N(3))-methyltransferase [Methylotenera sp.]
MSNLRFYSPEPLQIGASIKLSDNAAAHATRVMRLEISDEIVLFNGDGNDYICAITSIKKSETQAIVKSFVKITNESPLNITLLQGISSGDRMDYTIQKAVELGVTQIVPIITIRSVVKLSAERGEKRLAHWQSVVHSACEQSGRAFVPQVSAPATLSAWLATTPSPFKGEDKMPPTRILLNPIGAMRLAELPKPTGNIELLIGAEGGLSQAEIDTAFSQGFQSVVLGTRILRTETAALTAIAAMQTIWGDF